MTLIEIIEADALYMKDVTVEVVSNYGTVCIKDAKGVQEDIFMQGDDAVEFISQRDLLWEETRVLTKGTIELHLAKSYVDNLWS